MPRIMLARQKASKNVELFCIADDYLHTMPTGTRLQSLDTAGNALFSMPVEIYYQSVEYSSYFNLDSHVGFRHLQQAVLSRHASL
jgi:hypothetical protein